jgi:Uma2 family endonuclease
MGDRLQPDLFVVPHPERPAVRDWSELGVPLLTVEVLSPSTAHHDRITKRRRYQIAGVGTYWIVDLDACLVERWRPGEEQPAIEDRLLRWQPTQDVPPLELDLAVYFRPEWRTVAG